MKQKILEYIYRKNKDFFLRKTHFNLDESQFRYLYNQNKELFESFFTEEFVGFVPKDIREPTLKIFEEHGEMFQRWVLWQSYYINRKALHDPLHLTKYDGMMVYLKVLHMMAEANKKNVEPRVRKPQSAPEVPWIDKALEDINNFNKKIHDKTESTEGNQS